MARIKYHSPDDVIRGKVGNIVFKKSNRGTYMSLRPGMANGDYGLPPRLWPKALNIVVTQEGGRRVKLSITGHLAMRSIDGVDLARFDGRMGNPIVIHSRPAVSVGQIDVIISRAEGGRLEKGTAVLSADVPGQWLYTTRTEMPAATDLCIVLKALEKMGNGVYTIVT